jgi:hypothetical protein
VKPTTITAAPRRLRGLLAPLHLQHADGSLSRRLMQLPVPVNLFVSEGGHIRAFELVDVVEDGNSLGGKTFIYYEGELDESPPS